MKEDLVSTLKSALKPGKTVLLYESLPKEDLSLLRDALHATGHRLLIAESGCTWKQLLRLAFTGRASVLVAPAAVILGISKLAVNSGMPLKIRNALITAGPSDEWMCRSIADRLDCSITDMTPFLTNAGCYEADELESLRRDLLESSAVIDCRLAKGKYGLELDMVTYPGLKAPILPTLARKNVHTWNAEKDVPFSSALPVKIPLFYGENH